jgi:5-methylcytosine-specific restriction endonuclease McrA
MDVKANVLKLNVGYMPIEIIPWQDAVTLWYKGLAEIVSSYEDVQLRSWKTAMNCPAVIRLLHFVKPNKSFKVFKPFTRRNVFIRDGGICQYCGVKLSLNSMTYDHIVPQSKGGLTSWKNIICCCEKCNKKKGCKTLEESGMSLIKKPYAPIIANDYTESIRSKFSNCKSILEIKEWRDYIYWNVELES